jgi:uncharacterized phage-like protein YoqJ
MVCLYRKFRIRILGFGSSTELQSEKGTNVKLACIFLFENHGDHWNESNQEKLTKFKNVDFVKYIYQTINLQFNFVSTINF